MFLDMKKHLILIAAIICLASSVLFLSGCGKGKQTEAEAEKEAHTKELFQYIPDGEYLSLSYADVDSIISSAWAQKFLELFQPLELWDEKLGVNIEQFHMLTMAVGMPRKGDLDPSVLMVMSSDVTMDEVLSMIGEKSYYFKKQEVGKYIQYFSGSDFSFGFLDDGIVLLGTPDMVEEALNLGNGDGVSLVDGRGLGYFEDYMSNRDNFWIGVGGFDDLLGEVTSEYSFMKGFSKIEFIYVGMEVGDNVIPRIVAECTSEQAAGKIARGLSGMLGLMGTLINMQDLQIDVPNEDVPLEELKELVEEFFDNISITSEGKKVIISMKIPERMLDFFLRLTRDFMKEVSSTPLPDHLDESGYSERLPEGSDSWN